MFSKMFNYLSVRKNLSCFEKGIVPKGKLTNKPSFGIFCICTELRFNYVQWYIINITYCLFGNNVKYVGNFDGSPTMPTRSVLVYFPIDVIQL